MNMSITETANNSGDTYKLRFATDLNGKVAYEGSEYTAGQVIDVPVGEFSLTYTGAEYGQHNIAFSITSSTNGNVTRDVAVEYTQINYEFSAAAQKVEIYKGSETALNFNVLENGATSTYQMRYVLSDTNAEILDESGNAIPAGSYLLIGDEEVE